MLISLLLSHAIAGDRGQTGSSTSGCASCHGSSASANTTVSFDLSASTVAPGDVVDVTFTVANSRQSEAGLDVSASGGTLAAGSNNQLRSGEITHSSPQTLSSGTFDFDFTWTAPTAEGTYTLYGAGNAVNADGRASNADNWTTGNTSIVVDDGCEDVDGDGYGDTCDEDCDEAEPAAWTGRAEICDDIDNDCNGSVDESAVDATTWYADTDGDGYGDRSVSTRACDAPVGSVAVSGDCADTDAARNPGAAEVCDGVDQDCDGVVDDNATDASTWYGDDDGDGYGDPDAPELACTQPADAVVNAEDCDDGNGAVSPDGVEVCDPADVDEDCDGSADDDDDSAGSLTDWYTDTDGDGYGDAAAGASCEAPEGAVAVAGDCDDSDAAFNPGAAESCTDATDYNCDGSTGYADADGDGYAACVECDDADSSVNPGVDEYCDRIDNNCDGAVDEATALDAASWYVDSDGDGYGSTDTVLACDQPALTSTNDLDCDDADGDAAPGNAEVWYDGADQACDGGSDYDADADGYDATSGGGDDCDDTDASTYPGAADAPYDGVVSDCDASDEYDVDGDGYAVDVDCDDADGAINPGAAEIWYDGVDQDCDLNDADQDGDGVTVDADCDDTDASVAVDCSEDTAVTDTGDTAGTPDTAAPDADDTGTPKADCGCASGGVGGFAAAWLVGAVVIAARRRRG